MFNGKISIIIPTLNAGNVIGNLIKILYQQTRCPDEIIVVDSESDDNTLEVLNGFSDVRVINIKRREFNHGGTRDMAFRASNGEYVLFITQDAIPYDNNYIENLIKIFDMDERIAMVSGRQMPRNDATEIEKLTRFFNYPDNTSVRSKDDLDKLGIKTFFFSDVCSAYKRNVYIELGGFDNLNTNEDMLIAAKAIFAGYKVAYSADAKVIHSHNFSLKQQYARNKEVGKFMREHKDFFGSISNEKEGMKMVKFITINLLKKGKLASIVYFYIQSFVKLVGYKKGIIEKNN